MLKGSAIEFLCEAEGHIRPVIAWKKRDITVFTSDCLKKHILFPEEYTISLN